VSSLGEAVAVGADDAVIMLAPSFIFNGLHATHKNKIKHVRTLVFLLNFIYINHTSFLLTHIHIQLIILSDNPGGVKTKSTGREGWPWLKASAAGAVRSRLGFMPKKSS